jgi:hypothetical protein
MILMRAIKRIPRKLGAVGTGIGLLAAVLLGRTVSLPSQQKDVAPAPEPDLDEEALSGRLSGALRFPTISKDEAEGWDDEAFSDFRGYLEQTYPRLHAALMRPTRTSFPSIRGARRPGNSRLSRATSSTATSGAGAPLTTSRTSSACWRRRSICLRQAFSPGALYSLPSATTRKSAESRVPPP